MNRINCSSRILPLVYGLRRNEKHIIIIICALVLYNKKGNLELAKTILNSLFITNTPTQIINSIIKRYECKFNIEDCKTNLTCLDECMEKLEDWLDVKHLPSHVLSVEGTKMTIVYGSILTERYIFELINSKWTKRNNKRSLSPPWGTQPSKHRDFYTIEIQIDMADEEDTVYFPLSNKLIPLQQTETNLGTDGTESMFEGDFSGIWTKGELPFYLEKFDTSKYRLD